MANNTKKIRTRQSHPKAVFSFRRHIIPPLLGLLAMPLAFVLLNSQLFIAQAEYHFKSSQPIALAAPAIISTKSPSSITSPQLTIPAIGAVTPIIFETSTADKAVQQALLKGVDHYGGTANPGQVGNTVVFGHSSGELWAPGKYKYVFTLLDKTKTGEQIIIDYQGTRYTYVVTGTEIILPSNLSVLNQQLNKPTLTLITCSPIGTNKYRLVVHADQISPTPVATAKSGVTDSFAKAQPELPGSAQVSLWQTLTSWL